MTVAELIEELQKFPADMSVVTKETDPFLGYGSCLGELETVEKQTVGYVTRGDDGKSITFKCGEVVVIGFWHG